MTSTNRPAASAPLAFLRGLTGLLAFWLVGEWLSRVLNLPLPGTVSGMLLLLGFCFVRGRSTPAITSASHALLSQLALFFVPAGVGLLAHGKLLAEHGLAMLATLALSTVLTLAVTALSLKYLLAKRKPTLPESDA